jgi:hypothetical protein
VIVAMDMPDGHCVALSRLFMSFSTKNLWPVMNPTRLPGATILEKLSMRMTRPSVSIERKVGTIGLSAPSGRIWRKQSDGVRVSPLS